MATKSTCCTECAKFYEKPIANAIQAQTRRIIGIAVKCLERHTLNKQPDGTVIRIHEESGKKVKCSCHKAMKEVVSK